MVFFSDLSLQTEAQMNKILRQIDKVEGSFQVYDEKARQRIEKAEDLGWIRGFACGCSEALAYGSDPDPIIRALRAAGLTMAMMRKAGVEDFDLSRIQDACFPKAKRKSKPKVKKKASP